MTIPEQVIREVRSRADIVQLVGRTVDLKKRGANWQGLCPFHQEKTPSFHVSPDRGTYYCFGCHESGDAISFVQHTDGKSFPEALKMLADQVGIVIEEREETPAQRQARVQRQELAEVTEAALEHYRDQLTQPSGKGASAYLKGRGVLTSQIDRFALGFGGFGRDLGKTSKVSQLPADKLISAGILARSDTGTYHRFSERIIFPIRDTAGRVVAFGARVFGKRDDGKLAKYVNSPESPLFHKGDVLYGLFEARPALRKSGTAVMVEGYLDVLALQRLGVETALAPCGTALTRNQARLLARNAKAVTLIFDGDDAGQKATKRALPILLATGLEVHLVELPKGEDPDTLARRSPETLKKMINGAAMALEIWIERTSSTRGPGVAGQLAAVAELRDMINALPAGLARDLFMDKTATALVIEPHLLRRELKRTSAPPKEVPPEPVETVREEKIHQRERQVVRLFLECPELLSDPLSARLVDLIESAAVKQFVTAGIELAQKSQSVLSLDALREGLQNQALAAVAEEVAAGNRVFDSTEAQQILHEVCESLWQKRAKVEAEQLAREVDQAKTPEEQDEMLKKVMELNSQLRHGCPWLGVPRGDTEHNGLSDAAPVTG